MWCKFGHVTVGFVTNLVVNEDSHSVGELGAQGGLRPFHQKSTYLTELTLGPYVVQVWSRIVRKSERTKPSNSTVWVAQPKAASCSSEYGKGVVVSRLCTTSRTVSDR